MCTLLKGLFTYRPPSYQVSPLQLPQPCATSCPPFGQCVSWGYCHGIIRSGTQVKVCFAYFKSILLYNHTWRCYVTCTFPSFDNIIHDNNVCKALLITITLTITRRESKKPSSNDLFGQIIHIKNNIGQFAGENHFSN